jgi:RimJ/RimL family protein N-acetyltransferase
VRTTIEGRGLLTLVPLDRALLRDLLADPAGALATHARASNAEEIGPVVRQVAEATLVLQERTGAREPWVGYLARRGADGAVVGTCAFTGQPSGAEGCVEIAYFTFPGHEGRGLATAMARALVRIARDAAGVGEVVAHTLPGEEGASARVLRRLGFRVAAPVRDAEHGEVWRWSLPLRGDDARG